MYSQLTFDAILRRMLNRVSSKLDKREGSIIWDALSPASVEFYNFYVVLEALLMEMFADTATRNFLIKHCADRGITPKKATHAKVTGEFVPDLGDKLIGQRFSHEDFNYVVTDKIETGLYHLECEQSGSEPNGFIGRLIPIGYIEGLQSAKIIDIDVYGEDDESTESLRARYFSSLKSESFGGNKTDYENKIMSLDDVGGVKVYSGADWNGGGTVKCVIQNSQYGVPSFETISYVQETIDPQITIAEDTGDTQFGEHAGEGNGLAPIGHFVTVVPVNNEYIDVNTIITYDTNFTWDNVKDNVIAVVDEYFYSLNENWSAYDTIRVRISQLESKLLNINGIIDIQETTLNGVAENFVAHKDSIVTRRTINGYSGS